MVIRIVKKHVITDARYLQLCAEQEAGNETAIRAIQETLMTIKLKQFEAILLLNAEKAISLTIPKLATFIYKCYVIPARSFIAGGKEIRSCERATQRDPAAMATYTTGLKDLLDDLEDISSGTKHAVFADDITGEESYIKSSRGGTIYESKNDIMAII